MKRSSGLGIGSLLQPRGLHKSEWSSTCPVSSKIHLPTTRSDLIKQFKLQNSLLKIHHDVACRLEFQIPDSLVSVSTKICIPPPNTRPLRDHRAPECHCAIPRLQENHCTIPRASRRILVLKGHAENNFDRPADSGANAVRPPLNS